MCEHIISCSVVFRKTLIVNVYLSIILKLFHLFYPLHFHEIGYISLLHSGTTCVLHMHTYLFIFIYFSTCEKLLQYVT